MNSDSVIVTERLVLRHWREADLAPFITMNQDPKVMEYMPSLLTDEQVTLFYEGMQQHFKMHGYGLYACTVDQQFIGFVGLNVAKFEAHFTPAVEIGWRLAYPYWGKGYATEAARAVVKFAFQQFGLKEIVSFTAIQNMRSRRVMEKLGMTHDPKENFAHPKLVPTHPLSMHVLYRLQSA